MANQSFEKHAQIVPGFMINLLVLLITFVGSMVNLYESWSDPQRHYSAALLVVLTGCLMVTTFFARTFPLKAQDRAIRAEENLRHFVLTGKLLDPRLAPLQIVALRFASDAEFPELARKAAEANMVPVDIKKSVKNWRPDTYRV